MTIQDPFPGAQPLAAVCERVVREWHSRPPPLEWPTALASLAPRVDGWAGEVGRLALINCFQWHLEDDCRSSYDDAVRLAALKREIDESNRRRVESIDAIDLGLAESLAASGPAEQSAPVAVLTPGALLDRISILELKRFHAPARSDVAAHVEEELADVCAGLDRLVAALAAREERLRVYRTVKLYGTDAGTT